MLFRKLLRTAGRYKAQFISMIIMTALGIGMFLGFNMEWVSINNNTFRFFDETGFADYRIMSEDGFTADDASKISSIAGRDNVSRYLAVNADLEKVNDQDHESGHVLSVTVTENPIVSGFVIMEGQEYDAASDDGIWLFDRFADENGISIGDSLELSYDSLKISGIVKGFIESSEYLICIQDETQVMPDFRKFGYCYISPVLLEKTVTSMVSDEVNKESRSSLKDGLEEAVSEASEKLEQAKSALDQLEPLAAFSEEYRVQYEELRAAYEEGTAKADEIRDQAGRIDSMEDDELSSLLEEYADSSLDEMISEAKDEAFDNIYHQINVISDMEADEFKEDVKDALGKTLVVLTRNENISYSESQGEANEGKTMGSILPVLFLLISVLTMVTTMHRIATNEKTQIGTLKALGFKDRRILLHYSCYTLMIGIVGTALGIALGYLVCWIIMNPNGMMGTYFVMPYWDLIIPWWCWIIMIAVIAVMVLIGMLSTKKMMAGSAADALKPYVPSVKKQMLLERTRLWEQLKFGTRWNLRDIFRHKSRSAVTLIGVIGCMVLMVGGIGMYETATAFVRITYSENARYASKAFVSDSATDDDAVSLAEKYKGDYSAQISVQLEDSTYSLEIYHIENDLIHFIDADNNDIKLPDDGALVCLRIAEKFALKPGDVINVSPFGTDEEYFLTVAGTFRSVSESIIISDTYAKSVKYAGVPITRSDIYRISNIYTMTEKSDIREDLISAVQSKTDIAESMDSFMEILNTFVVVLVVAAIILGIVVLYNLGVMSYTERYREMATLKVIGFKNKKLKNLLIGQNMWLTVIGIILGFGAGYLVLWWLMKALAPEYEMKITIGPLTIIVSVVLTFAVSLIVGLMVSGKSRKIDMVEALKMPE